MVWGHRQRPISGLQSDQVFAATKSQSGNCDPKFGTVRRQDARFIKSASRIGELTPRGSLFSFR